MQAIQTRYKGPTDTKGTRIIATATGGTLTMPYHYELDDDTNHREAAWKLISKLGW